MIRVHRTLYTVYVMYVKSQSCVILVFLVVNHHYLYIGPTKPASPCDTTVTCLLLESF